MMHEVMEDAKQKMGMSVDSFKEQISGIRAGVAHPSMVENLQIEVDPKERTFAKLRQIATIRAVNGNELRIEPWDGASVLPIQRAVSESQLGLNSRVDSKGGQKVIVVSIPPLSEEHRRRLEQQVKTAGEKAKIDVRNIRRSHNDSVNKNIAGKKKDNKEKDGLKVVFSEDEARKLNDELDKLTNQFIAEIDKVVAARQKDIMSS